MADVFKEQLIKRSVTNKDRLAQVGIITGVVLVIVVTVNIVPQLALVITAAVGFVAYIFIGRLKKEYEYIFTNGELDIDVIYNRSSRKRVFSGNVRDFELMAHIDDPNHKNSFATAKEKRDYSAGIPSERSYSFLTNYNGKRTAIIIEPNDEILNVISKALTMRKFYPKK